MGANRKSSNGKFELLAGATLRRRREELKLSQTQLAEKAGLSTKNVSDIESGVVHINLTHLEKLCPGLEWRISDLILKTEQWTANPGALIQHHHFSEREAVKIEFPKSITPFQKKRWQKRAEAAARKEVLATSPLPSWLQGIVPAHLKEQHDASIDQLRRRNRQRDIEASPELCEVDEG